MLLEEKILLFFCLFIFCCFVKYKSVKTDIIFYKLKRKEVYNALHCGMHLLTAETIKDKIT